MASNISTLEEFLELSTGELKFYLQQRGLSSLGNRGNLAARALIAHEQNIEIVGTAESISSTLQKDYSNLLQSHEICFDPITADGFVDDLSIWPETNIGQVFTYFLDSKAFESEYIGQYKLRKAYSFFGSGFVDKIFCRKINSKVIVRSSVMPSQRIRDNQHQLWILFGDNGSVITGFCTCTAGQSKCCNHIAAVLYKIEFANEKGIKNPACTDQICIWNSSAKKVGPMKVKGMNITEHNRTKKETQTVFLNYKEKEDFDPRPEGMREVDESSKSELLSKIRDVLPKAIINTMFSPPPDKDVPPTFADLVIDIKQQKFAPDQQMELFTSKLSFNDEQLHELEKATRNQSKSRIWWEHRKGRVTASRFHEVHQKVQALNKNRKKSVKVKVTPLLLSFVEPEVLKNIPALDWGKINEKHAAESFMQQEGKKHKNPKLFVCGLFLLKSHPYIGSTPDNIFQCSCCEKRCIEYKCPYSIREEIIEESWHKTDFLEKKDGKIRLKQNHKYYSQVTGQIAITGLKFTYFVVYTKKSLHVEEIVFDNNHWLKVLESLIVFFKIYIQQYLLGIIQIFMCPMCDKPCLNKNEFESDEENSIRCNICNAWFHWGCSGITNAANVNGEFKCLLCQ